MENDKLAKREQYDIEKQEQEIVAKKWTGGVWEYGSGLVGIVSFIIAALNWLIGINVPFGDKAWIVLAFGSLLLFSVHDRLRSSKRIAELEKKVPFEVHKYPPACTLTGLINNDGEINSSFLFTIKVTMEIVNLVENPLRMSVESDFDMKLEKGYNQYEKSPMYIDPHKVTRILPVISLRYNTDFKEEKGHYIKPLKGVKIDFRFKTSSPQRSVIETVEVDPNKLNAQIENV